MDIDFEKLILLQKLDAEIKIFSLFLEEVPAHYEKIDEKIENSIQTVNQAKEKLSQNQKRRREFEAEVSNKKENIAKYMRQLNDVKTNKEYSSLLKEIEENRQKNDELEEQIIEEMLSADKIEEEIKISDLEAKAQIKKLSKEKDKLDKRKTEAEGNKKKLIQQKEQLASKIPSPQINLYLKIFNKKEGIALSPVKDDFCSMCHMRIRPQVLNELKEEIKIILCENCGRILYSLKKTT
ncbi:zinc ribbon domain-containing protein [Acidobacteriota bacterium]